MIGCETAGSALLEQCEAVPLCQEEWEEAHSIKAPFRRRRYIQTRSALRTLLSDACDSAVDAREWRFTRTPGGKPCLEYDPGFPMLEFSISHSRSITAIAVSNGEPIGIDIESTPPARSAIIPSLVALCPEECALLAAAPESERWHRFIKIWTAKEAYAKFLGMGVDLDFTAIRVDLARNRITCCRAQRRAMPDGALVAGYFKLDKNNLTVSCVFAENAEKLPRMYLLWHAPREEKASIISCFGKPQLPVPTLSGEQDGSSRHRRAFLFSVPTSRDIKQATTFNGGT
jgi:phosphopantetheinyl transferase